MNRQSCRFVEQIFCGGYFFTPVFTCTPLRLASRLPLSLASPVVLPPVFFLHRLFLSGNSASGLLGKYTVALCSSYRSMCLRCTTMCRAYARTRSRIKDVTKPMRMAGVKKVAQSLADANLSDCTLKAWI